MPRQANGVGARLADDADDRHRLVPTMEAQPTPMAAGQRARSALMSIGGGAWNALEASHDILLSLFLSLAEPRDERFGA